MQWIQSAEVLFKINVDPLATLEYIILPNIKVQFATLINIPV